MSEPVKLCLFCKHCEYDSGWGGTDVTPGDPAEFCCSRHPKYSSPSLHDRKGLQEWMRQAEVCPHYTPPTD